MKRKKENYIIENIKITDIAAEGKSIGRHNDKVVFVEYAVPGDILDVKVLKDKKSFSEAIPVKFHTYSASRTKPFCQHFGVCGGCKLQHVDYETQLFYKSKQVKDNLERIGKLQLPEIAPILPSARTSYYRNKLEFTFSSKRWLTPEEMHTAVGDPNALGFHVPGRFDKIIDIQHCYLQPEPSNAIRMAVREYARMHHLEFFDIREKKGLLRNLIVRISNQSKVMVIFQFFRDEPEIIRPLLQYLQERFPEIVSLYYVINSKGNETFHDLELKLFYGKPYIIERMENLEFRVGPKSFYQTNSEQAYTLYKVARDFAGLTGEEVVYDLYTGTGTIANFVSAQAKKVVGIEYEPMAIEDAKVNSQVNDITNTSFFAGDMKDLLTDQFVQQQGAPDVIITDPPRAGMHPDVVGMLKKVAAKRIVYVSCNPATQARDLAELSEFYEVKKVQPVDMFPHTHHVESVVLIERRK